LEGELGEDLLVELILLLGSVEGGSDLDDLGGVGWVSRSWETRVFGLEDGEGLVTEVKSLRSVPFGVVGDEEFGRGEGLGERFLRGGEEIKEDGMSVEVEEEGKTRRKLNEQK